MLGICYIIFMSVWRGGAPVSTTPDNLYAIFLAKNLAYHTKTKNIDVQYYFVRDMVEDKKVLLDKFDTLKNVADSLTNYVSTEKFSWCRESMGIDSLNL